MGFFMFIFHIMQKQLEVDSLRLGSVQEAWSVVCFSGSGCLRVATVEYDVPAAWSMDWLFPGKKIHKS